MSEARSSPLRVLMTADAVGGVWTYALDLIRALDRLGAEVTLATMGPEPGPAQRDRFFRSTCARLETSEYRLEWMDDPWADVEAAGEWLLSLEERVRPDVVHLNGYAHAALPWEAPVLVVGHSCVLSWWRSVKGEPAPPSWDRYRDAVARGLRAADLVVAPTRWMLEALRRHYGPLPTSTVVPNGRFVSRPPPVRREEAVLTVGRLWDAAKNVDALAAAAEEVPWPIRVAGEDRHPSGARRGLGDLHPLGVLNERELLREMARASIYALPARYEPFGLSALEAARSGCALILGDLPSLREVWDGAALYVSPDDPDAVAQAIRRLAGDPDELRERAAAARERSRRFRPARMGAEYLTLYRALSEGRTPAPANP